MNSRHGAWDTQQEKKGDPRRIQTLDMIERQVVTKQLRVGPVLHDIQSAGAAHPMQTHLSEEVVVLETLSEQQDVSAPALLRAPPQLLSNGQRQVPRVVAEPQQVRLVHPHLGQTCWGRGQGVGRAVAQKDWRDYSNQTK